MRLRRFRPKRDKGPPHAGDPHYAPRRGTAIKSEDELRSKRSSAYLGRAGALGFAPLPGSSPSR